MQNIPPGVTHPNAPSGSNGVSSDCQDGWAANAGQAIGEGIGSLLSNEGIAATGVGGSAGRELGGMLCTIAPDVGNPFNTGPDWLSDPRRDAPSTGGVCTDPGPTGGQSAGTDGGTCKGTDPTGGGFSSKDSYVDPTTGEPITNQGGKTIAGDPNATGTYLGEVDDPNFVNGGNQDSSSSNSSSSSSSSSSTPSSSDSSSTSANSSSTSSSSSTSGSTDTSNTQTQEAQQSTDPNGPKPNGGSMPADDTSGSGSSGPAGPRTNIYSSLTDQIGNVMMPTDDSAGGGTPRSNVANAMDLGAVAPLSATVLSRQQIM